MFGDYYVFMEEKKNIKYIYNKKIYVWDSDW